MVLGGHRSHSLTKTPPCRGPNHRFKLPDGGVGTWTEFWIKCRNKQFCRCEIPPNGQNISPAKQSSSCIGLVIPSSDKRKSHSMLLFCLSVVNCLVTRQGYFKCTCFPFYSLFPARFIFFFFCLIGGRVEVSLLLTVESACLQETNVHLKKKKEN